MMITDTVKNKMFNLLAEVDFKLIDIERAIHALWKGFENYTDDVELLSKGLMAKSSISDHMLRYDDVLAICTESIKQRRDDLEKLHDALFECYKEVTADE